MGNLTRDPELKYIPNGSAVTSFSLALNRKYKGSDGEMKEEVEYSKVVAWGKQAESCAKYLVKGSQAFVEGRLKTRSWEAEGGEKKSITEIVATNIQFMSKPESKPKQESDELGPDLDDGVPF